MNSPRRLTGLEAARTRFGESADRIAAFFSEGDPLADAAVVALRGLPNGRNLLSRALEHGIDAASASEPAPEALVQLFRQLERVPFWVDHERCARGGQVFLRCGPFGGIALGFGALARAYCSSGGNKPLALTGALIDSTADRIANTGRFVYAISLRDGLRKGNAGYRHSVNVRLLHSRVRLEVLGQGHWDMDRWGWPINQADMALTALLFSHGFAGFVRKLGVRVSDEEEQDLLHLWRYAGYLMGVREELLCADIRDAERLAALVDTMDAGPDDDSRRLLEALLQRKPSEIARSSERVHEVARRVFMAACREMIGEPYADHVGLPYGPSDFAFRYVLRPAVSVLNRAHNRIPGAAARAQRAGERYWAAVSSDAQTRKAKTRDGRAEPSRFAASTRA